MKRHPLYQSVRKFDQSLQRPLLERLSLEEADRVLYEMTLFHHQAKSYQHLEVLTLSDEADAESRYLIAAGCRLSSDLNDEVVSRLMDMLQDRDAAIEALSHQLREKLQERYRAFSLLKKAQELRNLTEETSEQTGLGMIL